MKIFDKNLYFIPEKNKNKSNDVSCRVIFE